MSVFLDSSAVVKLYADEPGGEQVRAIDGALIVSAISGVEVATAIWRKARAGAIALQDGARAARAAGLDFAAGEEAETRFDVVAAGSGILKLAARLPERHALDSHDAIQLATALTARAADPHCLTFVSFDRALVVAAAAEGFDVP